MNVKAHEPLAEAYIDNAGETYQKANVNGYKIFITGEQKP